MLAAKSKCARMSALSCLALIAGCASDTPAPERCGPYEVEEAGFAYRSQTARVDVQWHSEWTEAQGEALPEPLAPPDIWTHPHLSARYSAAMHEDSHASDVSRLAGPTPFGAEVEYFHVLEKGKRLSGMAPFYTFLDDETMVTISFGRDAATLLVVDVKDEIEVLDQVDIPGRGSTLFELAGKKGRVAIFRDTSGGAYSYVDKKGDVYVPGASNSIIRIPIRDRRIQRDAMVQLNLGYEVTKGSLEDVVINDMKEDNKLTAIMPDANGRIWFTSRYGIVGVMDPSRRTEDGCPVVHASPIAYFAAEQKLRQLFDPLSEEGEAFITEFNRGGADLEDFRALRAEARRIFMAESGPLEQIQNSFSVGRDGVYIVSNLALYKLRFDPESQQIELDPRWVDSYAAGELIYDNDHQIKPGHLNDGSGTTPTLVGDEHVVIVDNAEGQVNLLVFDQRDGRLVSKTPIFEPGAAAVENSVVAYEDHLVVANTYGYTDPFAVNPTAGGIMRLDLDGASGEYVPVAGWPATGHYDAKTATPKLSTANGLIYTYQRDEAAEGHKDWQVTALDFRTGARVFSIKGYFNDGEFQDNVSVLVKAGSLGRADYDRKVFNNIWGTFSFGPNNSLYIGAYRGFLRFRSSR